MFKKFISLILIISLLFTLLTACNKQTSSLSKEQDIADNQQEQDENEKNDETEQEINDQQQNSDKQGDESKEEVDLKAFNAYYDQQRGRYNFKGADLSGLTMPSIDKLSSFLLDTQTKLPDSFSETYKKLVSYGKDPGLNVKSLHDAGIKGKGVNVAIIDGVLLKEHSEFKDSIVFYEDLVDNKKVHYHGTLVTSILCGKESGIAPEANLYYVSYINDELQTQEKNEERYASLAKSIERIVEKNKELPKDEKIRVLSISSGWDPNAVAVADAINKAKSDGIFVVTARLYDHDELYFGGASREALSDPNDVNSYSAYYLEEFDNTQEILLAPMDARWVASDIGVDDYVMYSRGAWSMVVPYISGVYTLACQVYPEITPELFWETALSTGYELNQKDSKFKDKVVRIINPVKLIEELKNKEN